MRSRLAITGAMLTTASAFVFLALWVAAETVGGFRNPYAGLVAVVLLPTLFVLGLLLIPIGLLLAIRRSRRGPLEPTAWPVLDLNRPAARRGLLAVGVLTIVNVIILSMGSYGAVDHMDSPAFCGRTCHTPMQPQYEAWQQGPHANVACVECHIGAGAQAFLRYKWNGVHQLVGVVSGRFPRPIPAPVKNLRPAAEICGPCHSQWKGHGDRPRTVREYADDAAGTETTTTFAVHVTQGEPVVLAGGGRHWPKGTGVHWHADPSNRVEYASDEKREQILWVKVTTPEGTTREYTAEGISPDAVAKAGHRVMDCVDCHNQPVHQFPTSAARAVDEAIAAGRLKRGLPFVRREGVRLLGVEAPSQEEGLRAIDAGLRAFYAPGGGASKEATGALAAGASAAADPLAVDQAVAALQAIFRRSVYPSMKITFGTYHNHLGHDDNLGCMRCHDQSHTAADGTVLPSDCDLCHTQP